LLQNYQICYGNTCGRGVSWGQLRLPSKGSRVPVLRNFGGPLVFMPTPFNAELPNSVW